MADLRFEYIGPSDGFTCAGCGKWFATYRGICQHDDRVHGGARCTFMPGHYNVTGPFADEPDPQVVLDPEPRSVLDLDDGRGDA